MTFVYLGLLLAEWLALIALFLPFGVLVVAAMAKADRAPNREGVPSISPRHKRMTRWHVVAAILVIGSALLVPITLACAVANGGRCPLEGWTLALTETALWFWTLSILYGPMYAVRLRLQRVHAAELIGLGVCLLPLTFWTFTAFVPNDAPESTAVFGIVGGVSFILGLTVRNRRVRSLILVSSCVMMLVALTGLAGPSNPFWLLAAFAMGYMVFWSEWKHKTEVSGATAQETGLPPSLPNSPAPSVTATRDTAMRTATFIVVNLPCVVALCLVWFTVFRSEGSAPAAVFALAGLAIATIGALLTTMTPLAFGHSRLKADHAAATFVVVLIAATVMHLIEVPMVTADSNFGGEVGWKSVLGIFACIGALAIALTTLTGKARPIRPFMVAMVLPAAFLLPSDSFFVYAHGDSVIAWVQRLIETGITVTLLAIMWYVFGPGRRRAPSQAAGTDRLETVETAAA